MMATVTVAVRQPEEHECPEEKCRPVAAHFGNNTAHEQKRPQRYSTPEQRIPEKADELAHVLVLKRYELISDHEDNESKGDCN